MRFYFIPKSRTLFHLNIRILAVIIMQFDKLRSHIRIFHNKDLDSFKNIFLAEIILIAQVVRKRSIYIIRDNSIYSIKEKVLFIK